MGSAGDRWKATLRTANIYRKRLLCNDNCARFAKSETKRKSDAGKASQKQSSYRFNFIKFRFNLSLLSKGSHIWMSRMKNCKKSEMKKWKNCRHWRQRSLLCQRRII